VATRLEESELKDALAGTTWVIEGDSIVLDADFSDFVAGWAYAARVAEVAMDANHHPDILAHGWNKVRVTLSTHSVGGVTDLDVDLARKIDALQG